MTLTAITANRLTDGLVVYLAPDGGWTNALDAARLVEGGADAALADGQRGEADNSVTGVYAVEVRRDDGVVAPVSLREQIRAWGPTTHRDFARAARPGHLDHPDGVAAVVFSAEEG